MSKDVKIEVLYYKTQADVSLEFGLHGNYPLRLLSSACNDIGTFFQSLKRAVSRSEIIIAVGGYGEDNLPGFIARAVGKKCVIPNYRKAGIITETKYVLPENAIPLAPKSRRFGGFLIECGPQTIISLTDDKKIRLEIVEEFIVNYITEHHNVFNRPFSVPASEPEIDNKAVGEENTDTCVMPQDNTEPTLSSVNNDNSPDATSKEIPTPPLTAEAENETTVPTEIAPEQENAVIPPENCAETLYNDNSCDGIISEDSENNSSVKTAEQQPDAQEQHNDAEELQSDTEPEQLELNPNDITFENDEGGDSRYKTRHKRRIVRIVCLILSLLIIAGMMVVLCFFNRDKDKIRAETDYYTELQITYSAMSDDLSAAFDRIKAQNSDFVTWLTVPEVNIHHPVLTVPDVDNSERYLNSLPNGTYDKAGTLFSSDSVSLNLTPGNTVIYGSAAEGGIFEQLSSAVAEPQPVFEKVVTADSRYQATWTVLSAFSRSEAAGFDFTRTAFSDNDDYVSYLEQLSAFSGDAAEHRYKGYEKVILLVGIDGQEQYCISALLTSVRVLSTSNPVINNSSDRTESDIVSSDSQSDYSSEPDYDSDYEYTDIEYNENTSDIVLPLPPADNSSASETASKSEPSTPSSNISSASSQNTSSDNTSSAPSDTGSSTITSSQPAHSDSTSSQPSSTTSSATSSENTPSIDPMYTWDITLYVIDSATGIPYSGKAVDIIAMIIEDEMSPTIDPPEALIAQSIAAYNWLLNNGATKESTAPKVALDPNPYPQAFECAAAAKGSILMYGNTVAKTNYYAYSAGKTANTQDIWGGTAYPYLQSVDCSVDKELKDFITVSTYSSDKIKQLINSVCGIDVSSMPKTEWLKPVQYDANGLYCLKISIGGTEYNGRYLRGTLLTKANTGVATIRSTAYSITYDEEKDKFTVTCKGYGHGVGMSQRGAKAYAKLGWTHEQILAHFFPGTTLVKN